MNHEWQIKRWNKRMGELLITLNYETLKILLKGFIVRYNRDILYYTSL